MQEIEVVHIEQLPLGEKPLVSWREQAQEADFEDLLVGLHLRLEWQHSAWLFQGLLCQRNPYQGLFWGLALGLWAFEESFFGALCFKKLENNEINEYCNGKNTFVISLF